MPFDLSSYEPVEDRLAKFWADHPNGRFDTELLHFSDGVFIVKATVWRDSTDPTPAATGLAFERETQRGVNATSALENCETSSLGRCLANLGYAAKGKRPSREEMSKTSPPSGDRVVPSTPLPGDSAAQGTAADGVQAVPTSVAASSDAAASGGAGESQGEGLEPSSPAPQDFVAGDPYATATSDQFERLLAVCGGNKNKALLRLNRCTGQKFTWETAQGEAKRRELSAAITGEKLEGVA